jgi:hypothetical protein
MFKILPSIWGLLLLTLLMGMPPPALAQDGCLEHIVEVIPLAPAIEEVISDSGEATGTFYYEAIPVPYEPGQQLFLSANECGSGQDRMRTDDVVNITVQPGGRQWTYDFRSKARDSVLAAEDRIFDLTPLFQPGSNTLILELIDLTGPARSSQPIFLIKTMDPSQSLRTVEPARTPAPTFTSAPSPTPLPTALVLPAPTRPLAATQTITPVMLVTDPPLPGEETGTGWPGSQLWWLGLLPLLGLVIYTVSRRARRQPRLSDLGGDVVVTSSDGSEALTVDLDSTPQAKVEIGTSEQAEYWIPVETLTPVLVRLKAQYDALKNVEVVLEKLDPASREVVDSQPCIDNLPVKVGEFSFTYLNQFQEDLADEGVYDDAYRYA